MPRSSAFAWASRNKNPAGEAGPENTPTIVVSNRRLDELTEQTLKREISGRPGAVQILKKSFDTNELFETLQKFLGFEKAQASQGG